MVEGIYAGYQGFVALKDLAKEALEVRDAAKVRPIISELHGKLIEAHEAHLSLLARIGDLEKEIVKFENWEAEKQRYQLVKLDPGIMMYRLKEGMENGEPPHEICPNCYNNGKKSFLHNIGSGNGLTRWRCESCEFKQSTGRFTDPRPRRGRSTGWEA